MKITQTKLLSLLRQAKEELAKEGFVIDGLFGSYARGEATDTSDVDVLYHIERSFLERYPGFFAVGRIDEIRRYLADIIGKPVDLASKNTLSRTGKRYILSELVDV